MSIKGERSAPVTVALVEDHPEFRDDLTRTLKASDRFEMVAVCKDLPAGLSMIETRCPDVLLVDLGLPSGRGLMLIREAQRRWGARCVSAVVTMTGDEDHLMEAIGAGAKGYLFKAEQAAQWVQAIDGLARGQSAVHPKIAQRFLLQLKAMVSEQENPAHDLLTHIASGYTIEEAALHLSLTKAAAGEQIRAAYDAFLLPVPDLSPRELQLLSLLNKGYAFRMCAEIMQVSESTTKTQAARAYQKLGATNLQMALYEARAAGLIS